MLRQRLRTRTSALALIGRLLVVLLTIALLFYGTVLVLLALKAVGPSSLDAVSGYRRSYDYLSGLHERSVSDLARYVAGGGGALAFLVFGYLAVKALPRPYFARHDVDLIDDELGVVTVAPRAVERVAEGVALGHEGVSAAAGRYGDDALALGLTVRHARATADTMREVQASVAEALERHGLPVVPIHLTLTGFERRTQRELD